MIKNFRIIETETHQVLLTKDFDNDDEDNSPLLVITFFLDGVKVSQKLGYDSEKVRDRVFHEITMEQVSETVNSTAKMFR
jgi:hypothetical protein